MKKKTMRIIFILLLIVGIVVGYLLPGDLRQVSKKISSGLKPAVFDVPKKFGQLDMESEYFKYTILTSVDTGSIELIMLDEKIPKHLHPKENHFVYIYKGKAKGTVGDITADINAGQLVAIPAGAVHSFERIGDAPVEIILFSSPPFVKEDTVFLED